MFELIFFGGVIGLSWILLPSDHAILITLLGLILGILSFIQGMRTENLIKGTEKLIQEWREETKAILERMERETKEMFERMEARTMEMLERMSKETREMFERMGRETKVILDRIDERAEQRHRELLEKVVK
jgi:uncharacterized membrane-anchored protein YhcB (DUF1043 family)